MDVKIQDRSGSYWIIPLKSTVESTSERNRDRWRKIEKDGRWEMGDAVCGERNVVNVGGPTSSP
jgi:hypothetical protein